MISRTKSLLLVSVCTANLSSAFQVSRPQTALRTTAKPLSPPRTALQVLPCVDHDLLQSSVSIAVEFFDGSTVVDPVVVSNVFWSSLSAKIVSFLIGQAIAGAVFTAILFFFRSKISEIVGGVTQKIIDVVGNGGAKGTGFVKATDDAYINYEARGKLPPPDFGKLLVCVAVDVIGSSSELVPVLGEFTDVLYAPIAATILRSLYGGSNVLFALEFAEEILPFTDIVPLATICSSI